MIKNYLTIFFLAMVPIFELRGAIPVSQILGLPIVPSFIICIVANCTISLCGFLPAINIWLKKWCNPLLSVYGKYVRKSIRTLHLFLFFVR